MLTKEFFGREKAVIGMIHLKPLPGSPRYGGDLAAVYKAAEEDLRALEQNGVAAAIIENFGDVPYNHENDFITLAAMTAIAARLREKTDMVLGLNVQFNCTQEEWAMAYATGADFIRVEAFVETRLGTHGLSMPAAPTLMRQKGQYPAKTKLFCDINTKHTQPLVQEPIGDIIHSAREEGADALIVTGLVTGQNPTIEQVTEFCSHAGDTPVFLGSGINADNAADFFRVTDGAIVGSSFKYGGDVFDQVDPARVKQFMDGLRKANFDV